MMKKSKNPKSQTVSDLINSANIILNEFHKIIKVSRKENMPDQSSYLLEEEEAAFLEKETNKVEKSIVSLIEFLNKIVSE